MLVRRFVQWMFVVIAAFSLAVAPACAKKSAKGSAEEEGAGKKGARASSEGGMGEEDIPLANQGTLDESGRVRKGVAAAVEGASTGGSSAEVLIQDIHFAFDSSELDSDARSTLGEVKKLLNEHSGWKLTLEGHCDERGTQEYNLGLGQRRANSVKSYLKQLGIPSSRLDTVSFGEEYPVDPGHNESAWAKNRRVHFAFKGEI